MSTETSPGLIETMRVDRAGIRFLGRHMRRLSASADALGIVCPLDTVRRLLRMAVEEADEPQRLRVQLEPDGRVDVATAPLPPTPETPQGVVVATPRLNSADPLLQHKTTRRAIYEEARGELAGQAGLVDALLLNERDEVCEGGIANVFALIDGRLVTPPPMCGLLPGIMRGHVMEAYGAEEALLGVDDLRRARRLFLSNSVRGMIEVALVE